MSTKAITAADRSELRKLVAFKVHTLKTNINSRKENIQRRLMTSDESVADKYLSDLREMQHYYEGLMNKLAS
jgi:hypothetical protein